MPTLKQLLDTSNICTLLDEKKCEEIGRYAKDGYETDVQSRSEWAERQAFANKLALQVREEKVWPWPRCANIKFPLVTVAALQYQARAYPALIDTDDLVKVRLFGDDPTGQKTAIGDRISEHMTWQNTEQDEAWEEEHDKLLLVQPIAGCAFVKKAFDPAKGRQDTQLVLPEHFVINYWSKDLASSARYTHTFNLTSNDIVQRQMDGRYNDIDLGSPDPQTKQQNEITVAKDERQGIYPQGSDKVTPYFIGEQYCWMDLDDDEYEEPYIVTFDINSGKLLRICARFIPEGIKTRNGKKWDDRKAEIYAISPIKVFTKYGFIPSPDGGFYDLGLGSLVGPINETVNTIINQTLDAATMKSLGGGFVGRGFKSKSGPFTFQPHQWFPVDAPGDDLRKNILPLPVSDPSPVLLQLLELLVNYGERIVSATDLQMGENIGQNTPAETARTMDQNGARVYNAIYKRSWRSLREEFRIQADLNRFFLEYEADYPMLKQSGMVTADDYRQMGITIKPAADPHIVSDGERKQQAQMILSNAMQMPGHNRYQAMLRFYKAYKVPEIEQFMPPPQGAPGPDGKPTPAADFPSPPDPKMLEIQIKGQAQQLDQQRFQADQMEMKITLQREVMETQAKVLNLQAQAQLYVAQSKATEMEPEIKLIYAQIESLGARNSHLLQLIDTVNNSMHQSMDRATNSAHQNADRTVDTLHKNADRQLEMMSGDNQAGTGGTGLGSVENPSPNQGVPAIAGANGAGTAGLLV